MWLPLWSRATFPRAAFDNPVLRALLLMSASDCFPLIVSNSGNRQQLNKNSLLWKKICLFSRHRWDIWEQPWHLSSSSQILSCAWRALNSLMLHKSAWDRRNGITGGALIVQGSSMCSKSRRREGAELVGLWPGSTWEHLYFHLSLVWLSAWGNELGSFP